MRGTQLALLGTLLAAGPPALAAKVGDPVEPVDLPTSDSRRAAVVGSARADVFAFVRPGHEHSRAALAALAGLDNPKETRALAGRKGCESR